MPVAEVGEDRIPRLRTRVRHTTVIVLPAGERILDFVADSSEYWHLTGAAKVAYLKPLAEDAATNIALVCESGRIYSFLVSEAGEKPPHLVVRVEAGAEARPIWGLWRGRGAGFGGPGSRPPHAEAEPPCLVGRAHPRGGSAGRACQN